MAASSENTTSVEREAVTVEGAEKTVMERLKASAVYFLFQVFGDQISALCLPGGHMVPYLLFIFAWIKREQSRIPGQEILL